MAERGAEPPVQPEEVADENAEELPDREGKFHAIKRDAQEQLEQEIEQDPTTGGTDDR